MSSDAKKLDPEMSAEAKLEAVPSEVQAAEQETVKAAESKPRSNNLDLILDIPLKVSVELGRARMLVSDLLNLGQGSVIELNKLAGESMEVLVNDRLVAKGEAVVVNEKFGIRLTEIISQSERVEQLK